VNRTLDPRTCHKAEQLGPAEASLNRDQPIVQRDWIEAEQPGTDPERRSGKRMSPKVAYNHRAAGESISAQEQLHHRVPAQVVSHLAHQNQVHALLAQGRRSSAPNRHDQSFLLCQCRSGPV